MARTKQSSKNDTKSFRGFVAKKEPRNWYYQGARAAPSSSSRHQSKDCPTKGKRKYCDDSDDDLDWAQSSDSDADAAVATTTLTMKRGTGIVAAAASTSLAYSASSTSTGLTLDGMASQQANAPTATTTAATPTATTAAAVAKNPKAAAEAVVKKPKAAAADVVKKSKAAAAKNPKAAAEAVVKKPKAAAAKKSKAAAADVVKKPKAAAAKKSKAAAADVAKKSKATKSKRTGGKEAMKQKAKEYEEATDKDAWIKKYAPAEASLPKKFENTKIGNTRVYGMTFDQICAIPLKQVKDFSGRQLGALMKMIGGKYKYDTDKLRNAFTEFLTTQVVEKGYSNSNKSEYQRTAMTSSLAKPDQANPNAALLSLVVDPQLSSMTKDLISIEPNKIVINETPDDQDKSNLQMITNLMGSTRRINGNISVFVDTCVEMHFVIGPSSHGYYDKKKVESASYERQKLELIHPDITEDIEPNNNICSMRKF